MLRHSIRTALGLATLAACTAPVAAWAQGAPAGSPGNEAQLEDVVVTGTRVENRSRLDTLAPVDVLPTTTLTQQGTTELAQALSVAAPSLNFPRPAITDGTDVIRPAALRGLAPDQTLVLVNSKRRHQSALVNVNSSIGRGSAAVDLNAIPMAAIQTIEILRDGASAQYGSDAIAGVLNIRLREANHGGNASITYGAYDTNVKTYRDERDVTDGRTTTASAWAGFPLATDGFLTLSAEYRDRDPTSRGDLDTRNSVVPPRVTSRFGDPQTKDKTIYVNAGLPIGTWEGYGWLGYQNRDGQSAANFRRPADPNNILSVYPNGFLPYIVSDIDDYAAAVGTRGKAGEWDTDVSLVYGKNKLDYRTENSINASLGAASPTAFNSGGLQYEQIVFNVGFVRPFDWGLNAPVNVATGVEARRENYQIRAGEPDSYRRGPTPPPGTSAGAQGFPGFQPSNVVDESRTAYGAYIDLETQLTERLLGSAAARAEHYSDFGSTATGKLSLRFDVNQNFALRGTVSNGFRAPGLQQAFFTSTATNFINGVPFEVGTFPATSPIAGALGASELKPEKSTNFSLGTVIRGGGLELTIDGYWIEIRDRIVLSENLGGRPDIDAILAPFGVGRARFFINGVETKTKGVDLVARYIVEPEAVGKLEFTLSGNYNKTEVTKLPTTGVLTALTPPPVLFGRVNVLTFEEGTPKNKATFSIDWSRDVGFGDVGATLKAARYGTALEPGTAVNGSLDIPIETRTLVNAEVRTKLNMGVSLALGVDNAFDQYPDPNVPAVNGTGALGFTRYSPFGFGGRFYYGRVSYNW